MKIIPKIILYTIIIVFLFISLDYKADSKMESPKTDTFISKGGVKVETIPYSISGKVQIKNPVYKERIFISPDLEAGN